MPAQLSIMDVVLGPINKRVCAGEYGRYVLYVDIVVMSPDLCVCVCVCVNSSGN